MDIREWVDYNLSLRKKVVKKPLKLLLASFIGTEQQKDIKTQIIKDFFRVKINVKAWHEKIMKEKGLQAIDFTNNESVFSSMRDDFDIPYWAFISLTNKKPLKDYNNTFVYQLKCCNLHCPWCYVDDINKNGVEEGGRFFSIPEIIDVFESERKKQVLNVFRPSGGEPTIAVEQWLECIRELEKRNLDDVYIYGDTNLTTGHFIDVLEEKGEIEKNLLEKVAEHNFGLLCSFKGTDKESFLRATGMPKQFEFLEEERWYSFSKLVKAGIDVYPFIYDPNPTSLENFMEKGAKKFGDGFFLKTWIFKLKLYGPEKIRLKAKGINIDEYQKKLDENFRRSEEIMQNLIWHKFGLNYKAVPRTGIKLKIK